MANIPDGKRPEPLSLPVQMLSSTQTWALTALRGRVEGLALITNGPGDTQRHKDCGYRGRPYVDAIIISGEVGVAKPESAIFAAARRLGVPRDAAWHVGDSLANDVTGARNAGLGAAVWLNGTGRSTTPGGGLPVSSGPHWEITSLRDLVELLT